MEKTEEVKYGYSEETQKKIIAMLLFDKVAFTKNIEVIQPEFFDNPILTALAKIIIKHYEKYHKVPTQNEFLQEADDLILGNKKLPNEDYWDIVEKILTLGTLETFEYVKDKVYEFAKFQGFKTALIDSAGILQKSQDYTKINEKIDAAKRIGDLRKKAKLRSPVHAMEAEDVREEIIVKNWADELTISLVAGETKVGKSLLCLQLGTCIATGQDFLGFYIPRARRVLYIQQEIKESDIKRRWKKTASTLTAEQKKALDENFKYVTTTGHPLKLTEPKDKAELFGHVKEAKPDIVMLDPMLTFHDKKEGKSEDMSIVFDHIQDLMNTFNTAVLMVHHFRKAGNNDESSSVDKARGSSVITDRPDFIITVERINKKYKRDSLQLPHFYENYAELAFENRSWKKPTNMIIERDDVTLLYSESNLYTQLGIKVTPEEVQELIEKAGGEILQKDVLEMLMEKVSKRIGLDRIHEAVQKGYITREPLKTTGNPFILKLAGVKR